MKNEWQSGTILAEHVCTGKIRSIDRYLYKIKKIDRVSLDKVLSTIERPIFIIECVYRDIDEY